MAYNETTTKGKNMHTCTWLPPDPKFVLALRISELTFGYYLSLPAKTHLEKKAILGSYIVVSVDSPVSWGHMTKETFNELYKADEPWDETRYTTCSSK
jgi:hypothetical protein